MPVTSFFHMADISVRMNTDDRQPYIFYATHINGFLTYHW